MASLLRRVPDVSPYRSRILTGSWETLSLPRIQIRPFADCWIGLTRVSEGIRIAT